MAESLLVQMKVTIRPPCPAQMIDSLNQCIDGHLILVMAVLLGSGGAERVSLVDDEHGLRFLPAADEIF